ncbi:hypothetical protein Kpol_1009p10 [Vanderwaltozyma polyspora DSM 70294]|uniref:ATP synthase subunit H, mitochondrial n=1 Tax=Vanderwaltozyma polyspora (strain ATCC 22028 / DSM 70294 / BCRC 21397 / CBS 2163 / NBRC 10782 / NRRL Y-8283 / UCD 57-17) TaxID=436907 RepID=A7TPD6_VANPO|nr:uncharacterized protein Kpol_1009p10 [Vanderwaltozyma polyspora DSM 70294]EDO15864.1 hypothetical protein Kpol_1009p10 [Vanderwaltozyma polyspora DSM 70294]
MMFSVVRRNAVLLSKPLLSNGSRVIGARFISNDVLQDLYLKELKSAKPMSMQTDIDNANVKKWVEPIKPTIPQEEVTRDQLKQYTDEPVETVKAGASAAEDSNAAIAEDWLVLEEEPEDAAHAH